MSAVWDLLLRILEELVQSELKRFSFHLSGDDPEVCPSIPKGILQGGDRTDIVTAMQGYYGRGQRAAEVTRYILQKMDRNDLAERLADVADPVMKRIQEKLKINLKKRSERIYEGTDKQGVSVLLKSIYTEVYITDGGSGTVSNEHAVRQIETGGRKRVTEEAVIKCNDLFKALTLQQKSIRTVLMKGIAGVGKTVSVKKFILDWANGDANQEIDFVFTLPFRDLNSMKDKRFTLMELLHHYFPDMKAVECIDCDEFKVLFIFDGLDECRLPLDFQSSELNDAMEPATVDVLLANLIRGNLLPSALLWITTRPAAANKIPPGYIHQVTEVRGFNDEQKEEYFRKRFSDQNLACTAVKHIKSSRSLYTMCHIPVFCAISATVLERIILEGNGGETPCTLTQMYTRLLLIQTNITAYKYAETKDTDARRISESTRQAILKLGELAFRQLEKGNLIFYEEDLRECGLSVSEASVYSGMCTEIFKEETDFCEDRVYSFVHLSIQEYLAALYVFLSYGNLMSDAQWHGLKWMLGKLSLFDLHKSAVDKALQSENGHLDLFLRFLLGLSLDSNQSLLRGLQTRMGSTSQSIRETVKYIQEKIRENPSPERSINLFHCLNELNDNSFVEEIQTYLSSESLSNEKLSPAQWSALVFVLLMSKEVQDVFDLKKYARSDEGLLRLLPVVKRTRTALLNHCNLTEHCCEVLASTFSSASCSLRILDLSSNDLRDTGAKLLFAAVGSPDCRLETLRLSRCNLTDDSCESLALALQSASSHLTELDLSSNEYSGAGVKLLSAGLGNPNCQLQRLGLSGCQITEEGCTSLASALLSNPHKLRELDLSYNHPGKSGVILLSTLVEDPSCVVATHGGECRIKPGLQKYACSLTPDLNTTYRYLALSEGKRKITRGEEEQPYPDHPERFDIWAQTLCSEALTGRCYWEVEWSGRGMEVGVAYGGIGRKGAGHGCALGRNPNSWSLSCSGRLFSAWHNRKEYDVPASFPYSRRVGVYLDQRAGTLSFYSVSADGSTLLHTFYATFTQPLYAGFWVVSDSSVYLCQPA
ncbi:NACHT, LRR and PYD domains-containing protein 3-like [Megalops cyprinoides]|uniref:NACHT, LRR and PYD domains-containing protein 3-like n=1 Tax=Megalops cyprinoides TaxID=118141 RepID=UPI001864E0D9|nr:NACHT, LRR and PYD domains-containing protein 3-like [Megalops cyprinoides]